MSEVRASLPFDEQLRPFWPLLYVAWSDGELSEEEAALVRARLADAPWLAPAAREALARWLDPALPPTAAELSGLGRNIRAAAGTLPEEARRSLADLGASMAAEGSGEAAEVRAVLAALGEALGICSTEACAGVFDQRPAVPRPAEPAPRFDPAAMRALLERDHPEVRAEVRAFLSDPEHRAAFDLDTESHRARVLGWLGELARRGLGKAAYPGVTGGSDLGAMLVAFESLAAGDLSLLVKFGVQFGLFGGSIFFLGSERHHALLPRVASLDLLGCFAMTEVGHGSNVMDLETVATFHPERGDFVIHTPSESARKDYIGNAARDGRMATVFAQLEVGGERHGVHALLVPIRDAAGAPMPGVRIADCGPKVGLNGVDNGRLWFDHVRVPREALLDRFAQVDADGHYQSEIASKSKRFFTMLSTLVGGRVSVASAAVTAAKVGLTIAVRYGAARRQFGAAGEPERPVLDYHTHQRRLLPRLAGAYALGFAMEHLRARYLDQAPDRREVEALAAGLKAYATWHATETLQLCRECCGGAGYMAVNRLGTLKADTDVFTTFEGDNTVLCLLVAKGLLTGFKQQFSEARVFATVRWLAERARTAALQKNPLVTRLATSERLRDKDVLLAAFRSREADLTSTAARRVKQRIDAGATPFAATADVGDHLVALARAHVERIVLERFLAGVEACPPGALREALDRLSDLWALWRLEQDAAWFAENGYFEASRARGIRAVVDQLCAEVRIDALPLVEAFGIPDACLAAPIAFGDPAQLRI
jgi:acyl-CoA oxidase